MTLHTIYHSFKWDGDWWDMSITYEVVSHYPGYSGDYYEPPSGPEYEFKIIHIDHDLPKGSTPEPIYPGLMNVVEEWFKSPEGHEKASQQADDDRSEYDADYYDD